MNFQAVTCDPVRDALALRLIDPGSIVHITPDGDYFTHRQGSDCPCQPVVWLAVPNGALVVHQAWDGRE